MPAKINIQPGDRFGKLVVQCFDGNVIDSQGRKRHRLYKCLCDCGNITTVRASGLASGNTQSCGCLYLYGMRKHGLTGSPEYRAWRGLRARCLDSGHSDYPNYGGRGITVCKEWQDSFEAFYRDMGMRPSVNHQIERKDNNAGYCADNCEWATATKQARNRRSNRTATLNGETLCITEWAERLNMNDTTIAARLDAGWGDERALTTPVRCRSHR